MIAIFVNIKVVTPLVAKADGAGDTEGVQDRVGEAVFIGTLMVSTEYYDHRNFLLFIKSYQLSPGNLWDGIPHHIT